MINQNCGICYFWEHDYGDTITGICSKQSTKAFKNVTTCESGGECDDWRYKYGRLDTDGGEEA